MSVGLADAQPKGGARVALRFAVEDTGMGIAPADQRRIFERFERGTAAQAQGLSGTGLGLAIAQDIVRLMGGSLALRSVEGQGACFSFTVWFGLPESAGKASEARHAGAPSQQDDALHGVSVVLAEDNAITAHFMEHVLATAGCQVHTAADGQAVLRLQVRGYRVLEDDSWLDDE